MLNQALIQTSRKEALDELLAAIASTANPCDIRLVGPAIKHMSALMEAGYTNQGGAHL